MKDHKRAGGPPIRIIFQDGKLFIKKESVLSASRFIFSPGPGQKPVYHDALSDSPSFKLIKIFISSSTFILSSFLSVIY
jgi:hypothetical protein